MSRHTCKQVINYCKNNACYQLKTMQVPITRVIRPSYGKNCYITTQARWCKGNFHLPLEANLGRPRFRSTFQHLIAQSSTAGRLCTANHSTCIRNHTKNRACMGMGFAFPNFPCSYQLAVTTSLFFYTPLYHLIQTVAQNLRLG